MTLREFMAETFTNAMLTRVATSSCLESFYRMVRVDRCTRVASF